MDRTAWSTCSGLRTRPSVYWESGFAEREIPVIYICRKDHFDSKPSNDVVDFKVHFDLANANIISWSGRGSHRFIDELRKRLMFVTANMRANRKEQEKLIAIRSRFSQESLSKKRDLISDALKNSLLRLNYSLVGIDESEIVPFGRPISIYFDGTRLQAEIRNGLFWKRIGSAGILVSAHNCYSALDRYSFELIKDVQILNSMNDQRTFSNNLGEYTLT